MPHTLKERVLETTVASILAAILCAGGGFLLLRVLILKTAQSRMQSGVQRFQEQIESINAEAFSVLDAMNASPSPSCSDSDIALARRLILKSEFLKDAGRIRNGKVECSATYGREGLPATELQPVFTLFDNTRLYGKTSLYNADSGFMYLLQKGDSFVVFGRFAGRTLDTSGVHFSVMMHDAPSGRDGRFAGEPLLNNGAIVNRDANGIVGGTIYATKCSPRYCVNLYVTVPVVLEAARVQILVFSLLCGLIGWLIGFSLSLLYRRNRSIEQQLRRAVASDELKIAYQPIVDLTSGRIVGAEALARWTDEDGNTVPPDIFIPIAEERGFVGQITRLVVHRILRDFAEIMRSHPDFHVSVNVAPDDLSDPEFLPMLDQALATAKVDARSLIIEITESSTARHEIAIDTILSLRQRGHLIHIDDFGTGYSSLSYLHSLSIDAIKIDRSFTQAVGTQGITVGILPQILSMADALNLQVVVEGIETSEQAKYFSGTDRQTLAQGWLFSRPIPAEIFHRALTEDRAGHAEKAAEQ
jgi:sensor c-di-GMP phosphodiesterase-like protein